MKTIGDTQMMTSLPLVILPTPIKYLHPSRPEPAEDRAKRPQKALDIWVRTRNGG